MVEDRSKIAGLLARLSQSIQLSTRQKKSVKTRASKQEGQHMSSEIEPEASTGKGTH
jgi:hypothetical protein